MKKAILIGMIFLGLVACTGEEALIIKNANIDDVYSHIINIGKARGYQITSHRTSPKLMAIHFEMGSYLYPSQSDLRSNSSTSYHQTGNDTTDTQHGNSYTRTHVSHTSLPASEQVLSAGFELTQSQQDVYLTVTWDVARRETVSIINQLQRYYVIQKAN